LQLSFAISLPPTQASARLQLGGRHGWSLMSTYSIVAALSLLEVTSGDH
jgi:hypothetical protein